MRLVFAALGLISVFCAIAGVVLPLVPTVPFLLLAAFFFARSSDRLHAWLLNHRQFGPMINDWNERGAISHRAKKAATLSVAAVFSFSIWIELPYHVLAIQAATLGCVMIFIWSRPSG